jgi:site-specific DNA recombinase
MVDTIGTKTLRAVGYFRVSTSGQVGEKHSSLETQQGRFNDYCQRNHLSAVATFTDVASGRRDNRKEYQRMVQFVLGGGADIIVVQFLDRFGRNPREILRRYWELEERGITVVATDEEIKEEILLLVRAGIAGMESRHLSERIRANQGKTVSKGVHIGRDPYGFRRVKTVEDGKVVTKWEIEPAEAAVVREMYRMAVEENMGFKAIADRLAEKGHRSKAGRPFAAFTVKGIITNPSLMGTLAWGRKPSKGNPQQEIVEVPNFFPPILSQEEWEKLQTRMAIRRELPRGKSHVSDYLLSGILRCGSCGRPMSGKAHRSNKKHYRYYVCSRAHEGKALCSNPYNYPAEKIEEAVLEYLGQFSDPDKVRELVEKALDQMNSQSSVKQREKELEAIEKRIRQLEELLLKDIDRLDRGVLTEAEFTLISQTRRAEVAKLEASKEESARRLQEASNREKLVERVPVEVRSFLEDFRELDVRQQKARLQSLIKTVLFHTDGRLDIEFRD